MITFIPLDFIYEIFFSKEISKRKFYEIISLITKLEAVNRRNVPQTTEKDADSDFLFLLDYCKLFFVQYRKPPTTIIGCL